jgi:hypothetical protein
MNCTYDAQVPAAAIKGRQAGDDSAAAIPAQLTAPGRPVATERRRRPTVLERHVE